MALKPINGYLTSAAYRESGEADRAKEAVDPANRFFWRHEKRRLEGEVVRDTLLACGNRLDERMFGPVRSMKRSAAAASTSRSAERAGADDAGLRRA